MTSRLFRGRARGPRRSIVGRRVMPREETFPLSPLQHGMLIRSLAAPQSGACVQQLVCRFGESFDARVFEDAWRQIDARHPMFRTSLHWREAGPPYQKVRDTTALEFIARDCRDLPDARQQETLANFLVEDRRRGFDLEQGPLSRHALFRFGAADYRWVWTSHHAVLDGRSRLLVLSGIVRPLRGPAGRDAPGSAAAAAVSALHRLALRTGLRVIGAVLDPRARGVHFPHPIGGRSRARRPLARANTSGHDEQSFSFSEGATARLCDLARRHGLTPNTFLQGAWAILLSRYSGDEDVVFGATRAGRHPDVEGSAAMVGLLIHTVPVRVRVAPGQRLLDWLEDLRSRWVGLRDHERTSLADIHRWSQVPPDQPLFESLLTFESYELNSALQGQLPRRLGAEFRLVGGPQYPLAVTGALGPALHLRVTYDRSRFDASPIARMLGHLENAAGRHGGRSGAEDRGPAAAHRRRAPSVARRSGTTPRGTIAGTGACTSCSSSRRAQHPMRVAVVFEDRQLTYGELECAGEPGRPPPPAARCRTRSDRRAAHDALAGDDRRTARHSQGGRGLSAAGSGRSRGACSRHARGFRRRCRVDPAGPVGEPSARNGDRVPLPPPARPPRARHASPDTQRSAWMPTGPSSAGSRQPTSRAARRSRTWPT